MKMTLPSLPKWSTLLPKHSQVCLFGGAIRDGSLGLPARDHDYLVAGVTPQEVEATGLVRGHHAFIERYEYPLDMKDEVMRSPFSGTPQESMKKMLLTRDLTIHAVGLDMKTQEWFDPTGRGLDDLNHRVFRRVQDDVCDDPIVLLRWARFKEKYAPYGFKMDDESWMLAVEVAKEIGYQTSDPFRIARQFDLINASLMAEKIWETLQKEGLKEVLEEAVSRIDTLSENKPFRGLKP